MRYRGLWVLKEMKKWAMWIFGGGTLQDGAYMGSSRNGWPRAQWARERGGGEITEAEDTKVYQVLVGHEKVFVFNLVNTRSYWRFWTEE